MPELSHGPLSACPTSKVQLAAESAAAPGSVAKARHGAVIQGSCGQAPQAWHMALPLFTRLCLFTRLMGIISMAVCPVYLLIFSFKISLPEGDGRFMEIHIDKPTIFGARSTAMVRLK